MAALLPDASGRNIVSGHEATVLERAKALRERFGDWLRCPAGRCRRGSWLVEPAVRQTRTFVARNVGPAWHADTSKSLRELGLAYRPKKASLEGMVEQMLEAGVFAKG